MNNKNNLIRLTKEEADKLVKDGKGKYFNFGNEDDYILKYENNHYVKREPNSFYERMNFELNNQGGKNE